MKKFLSIILSTIIIISATPVYAYQYNFESGADTKSTFGKSTSNDEPVPINQETANVRRNKDAAYIPPSYGIFSGEIPTNHSSPYHNNSPSNANTSNGTSTNNYTGSGNVSNFVSDSNLPNSMLPSTSVTSNTGSTINTTPLYYDDRSIGTLHIPKINKTLKVYEGESLDNMKKGIGHFENTSAWDNNVGFAGHNRGASGYFGFVKDLKIGDKIVYTTKYGKRTYEIFNKEKISETDYTSLAWSTENIITLVTCVENQPSLRWSVQAREIK